MKIEPMKNRINRTSENLAEMRDYTTDPQLQELLDTVLNALEGVGNRLDQLELEQENYHIDSFLMLRSRLF